MAGYSTGSPRGACVVALCPEGLLSSHRLTFCPEWKPTNWGPLETLPFRRGPMAEFLCEYIADKLREISPESDEEMGDEEKRKSKEEREQIDQWTRHLLGGLQGFGDERSLAIESLFKKAGASFLEG